MTFVLAGLTCVACGLVNVPFFPDSLAYASFGFCMALALVNFTCAAVMW